jgi:hypothetical protein
MRHLIVATGILAFTLHASAQTQTAKPQTATTQSGAAAEATAPLLTKTVEVEAGDSPMVRAAKRAVASRGPASQRRVVSLTTNGTHGRIAISSGPKQGPTVLPLTTNWATPQKPQPSVAEQQAAAQAAERTEKLKKLELEQQGLAAQLDEETPNDIDEDALDRRMAEIEGEQKKLQQQQQTQRPPQR